MLIIAKNMLANGAFVRVGIERVKSGARREINFILPCLFGVCGINCGMHAIKSKWRNRRNHNATNITLAHYLSMSLLHTAKFNLHSGVRVVTAPMNT